MQPVLEPAPPYLVRKRESIGLSLREIANSTHIGVPYLEAIEGGDFAQLPHGVYALSYIRQYAAAIGCDEAPLIENYRRSQQPETVEPVIVGPFLQHSKRARTSWLKRIWV